MSAQMIENRMFSSTFNKVLILRFHARPEFVGTLCEGMAAFDENGSLLSANRNGCIQLGKSLDQIRGSSFSSLFGQPISRLFDHLLVRPQDPFVLTFDALAPAFPPRDPESASCTHTVPAHQGGGQLSQRLRIDRH